MRFFAPETGERLRPSARDRVRVRNPSLAGVDPLLTLALGTLGALGIVNLLALDETSLAIHQAACVALGFLAMLLTARARAVQLRVLGRVIYGVAIVLLLGVAAAGSHAFGAQRWLQLGSVVFQPSEMAKLGLLLVLAEVLVSKPRKRHRLLLALGVTAVPVVLTLLEPDLSTALLLAVVAAAMILLSRVRLRSLLSLLIAGAVTLPAGLRLLRPYQLSRLNSFLAGGGDSAAGWTRLQAHIAVASGGLLGTLSPLPPRLLSQYLPARETDLAFASLVEQRGLVAGGVVLLAGAVAVWRLVAVARHTRTEVGSLIASGFAALLGAEVAINVAGNLGLLPLAGVPFPMLSFGGTSVVAHFVAVGAVMGERRDEQRRRLWCPPLWARPRPRLARATAGALALALAGLALSTFDLQHNDGAMLRQAALVEASRALVVPAGRGVIEDRHGVPLAYDAAVQRVLAVPSIVAQTRGTDSRLALLLKKPLASVDRALQSRPPYGGFDVVVAASVSDAMAAAVQRAHLPGVIVAPVVQRVYPYGSLLAPLLGFVGVETAADLRTFGRLPPDEIVGRAALEREYDSVLRGHDGVQRLLVDPAGVPAAMGTSVQPTPGGDLRLSVDLGLQQEATAALANALRGVGHGQPRGDEGSVVVMDAHTGAILAMASLPAYDDNAFTPPVDIAAINRELSEPGDPFLEHATQTALPPGSTFKLVVAAADLATRTVAPDLVVPTGSTFTLGRVTFGNWSDLPPQDLPEAVAWSNDVYFYKLALALGPQRIDSVAAEMGVGRATGIDLPGESVGVLGTPDGVRAAGDGWYPGTTAMMGIGQGYLAVTPLQDARWTAAAATGELVTPHLALDARDAGAIGYGPVTTPAPARLPFAAALGPLTAGMRQGVVNGTGTLLRTLPQPAAGKTGTAQDPSAPDGGPDAWYTAYSPAADPQVVVTVSVRGGGEGAWTAEPVARDVLAYFDAHQAQIMSVAPPAPQKAAAAATRRPRSATPPAAPAVLAMLPLSGLRTLRPRPAATGWLRRPRRRTSEGGSTGAPRTRTRPPAAARSPAAASRRRRPGRRPA